MKLLIESVEMSMKILDTLPNLYKTKMKATLRKLLDDDRVRILKVTKEIKSQTETMIDKFFETKPNANSSNKTKKMVGGDRYTCDICLVTNIGIDSSELVCCPSYPQHHVFHVDYALEWLLSTPSCPTCRAIWNPVEQPLLHPGQNNYPVYNESHIDEEEDDEVDEDDVEIPNRTSFFSNFLPNTRRRANNF